jgi:hypothetical protein
MGAMNTNQPALDNYFQMLEDKNEQINSLKQKIATL